MRAIPSQGESPVGERGKAPFDDSSEDFLLGLGVCFLFRPFSPFKTFMRAREAKTFLDKGLLAILRL